MLINERVNRARDHILDYLLICSMNNIIDPRRIEHCSSEVQDRLTVFSANMSDLLDSALDDPRRRKVRVYDRLVAYNEYLNRALAGARKIRECEIISELEFKDFRKMLDSYFAEVFEVAYHPEDRS